IEAAGAQAVVVDPDRVGTMVQALEHVTVALILLGSARGPAEGLAALHGPRLQTLLTRMVDTTIKGVIYEGRGTVDPELLAAGAASVRAFKARSRARAAVLQDDPTHHEAWLTETLSAVQAVLAPSQGAISRIQSRRG